MDRAEEELRCALSVLMSAITHLPRLKVWWLNLLAAMISRVARWCFIACGLMSSYWFSRLKMMLLASTTKGGLSTYR